MRKFLILIFCLIFSNSVESKPSKTLNLSCEYDPDLIKIQQKDNGFLAYEKIDRSRICETFGCNDRVEVRKYDALPSDRDEYRLRNFWFNHQGILLDDFLITDSDIIINTFVSQAFFLESYQINKNTGKTKRIFYRFDNADFLNDIDKLEKNSSLSSLYNKKGKLSLEVLKSYSLEPWETLYFEGKCLEGKGV